MPFIEKKRRPIVRKMAYNDDMSPGERCFRVYETLMKMWKREPRWRTADLLFKLTFGGDPEARAAKLAFLVFFALHAMPYELKMRRKNGDVKG